MIQLLTGDVRAVLPTLPDASVQCVVSSPPYWNLRDYGTAQWEGGDAECDHRKQHSMATSGLEGGKTTTLHAHYHREQCPCGARRIDAQIGLEATPEAFIAELVAVFRQIRRVMRDDAVAFVNLGDSYQDKQLQMIPSRVALALQADGWWLRSDIVWAKPNPIPESCRDRPTSAHEHVYLLTKRSRYYFDQEAVREDVTGNQHAGRSDGGIPVPRGGGVDTGGARPSMPGGLVTSRNIRNVWTIATAPFPAAHFATFPPELAERCIRAGTSERGCCAQCGAPRARVVDRETRPNAPSLTGKYNGEGVHRTISGGVWNDARESVDRGWEPSCQCNAETRPCVVLDPFSGAGTALLVADRLGRDAIGIDLSHAYVEMSRERLHADCPLFADISPPPAEDPEDERMADLFAMAAD